MKIRNRLALYFTIIYAVVIFFILMFSFLTSREYTRNDFFARIKERVFLASRVFLKQDNYTINTYLPFKNRFSQKLPAEIIQVFDKGNQHVFIEKSPGFFVTTAQINQIRKIKELRYSYGDRQFYGIFYQDNQGEFVIIASAIDVDGMERLHNLFTAMLAGFVISILVIYFLGQFFAKKTLEPITQIVRQVKQITVSNLNIRVNEGKNKDEIAELATTFNNVLEKLEESFRLQKTFVNNASHELRTPLTSIIAELEILLHKERDKEEYKEVMVNVLKETRQMKVLVNNLLSIAHTEISNPKGFIDEIRIDELLLEIRNEIMLRNSGLIIRLEFDSLPEDEAKLTVHGNKQLLHTAFTNLIDNAGKFSSGKEVVCNLTYLDNKLVIRVIDRGIGITASDMKNIFQPFFRASNASGFPGHGMGLSLSAKIIRMHGGRIELFSEQNSGTIVEITF